MKDKTFAEHFLKLEGRLNRLRYLKRILVLMLIGAIIGAVAGVIFHADTGEFELVIIIMSFCMMPMQYCLAVRRLHDMNRNENIAQFYICCGLASNLMVLLNYSLETFATILSLIISVLAIFFLVMPGTKGPNDYGPDPIA
ncbi:MAG: DUF805 domain-containing protein [Selenomonadaceae bacterium]|nr:DUF805 domain-containing protein [Selenomonadaceae bacterium]